MLRHAPMLSIIAEDTILIVFKNGSTGRTQCGSQVCRKSGGVGSVAGKEPPQMRSVVRILPLKEIYNELSIGEVRKYSPWLTVNMLRSVTDPDVSDIRQTFAQHVSYVVLHRRQLVRQAPLQYTSMNLLIMGEINEREVDRLD